MARRRKDTETPKKFAFEVPEFDEEEFIRKETIGFRTTLVLFVYSVVTAFLTFVLWRILLPTTGANGAWFVALLIGLALGYFLRFIYPALKVDISHFGKKEWTGTGFLYFFSWLAFFIFLVNPPIYDGVAPQMEIHITPDAQTPGGEVFVTLLAFDNVGIDEDSVSFEVVGPDGPVAATGSLETIPARSSAWRWSQSFDEDARGTYTVTARVTDSNGHTTEKTREFHIGARALDVRPVDGTLQTKLDRITVEIPEEVDVWRVWLEPQVSGETIRVYLEHDDKTDLWTTTSEAAGFREYFERTDNLTMTFNAFAEEHDSYLLPGEHEVPPSGGLIQSGPHQVTFDDETLLTGELDTSEPRKRAIGPQEVPGAGPGVLLATALVGLALAARIRRRA